ncbi:fatty acyl-CoA synthetase [Leucobacter sp. BZR 635]
MKHTTAQATTNLATLLRQTARRLPNERAIVRGATAWTWREFDERVDALAAAFCASGFGVGSTIMLHANNSRDYLTVMYATWRIGATITPTNCKLTQSELTDLADVISPDLIIHGTTNQIDPALAESATVWTISDDDPITGEPSVEGLIEANAGSPVADAPVAVGQPAWYIFTSGTSGRPKAAVLSHDHLTFVINNHIADLMPGLSNGDSTLVLAPLSHGAGVHALMHVARGAGIIMLPGDSLNVGEAWSLIADHRVSTLFTVPTILNRLVEGVNETTDLSSLRFVIHAGAPITQQDQRRAVEVLGPVVVQYYGQAEVTGAITVLPPEGNLDIPTYEGIVSAGYPRTGMDVVIKNEAGDILGSGQRGEICVIGPAVFSGYFANDEANAKSFRDGWFHTGDFGILDERGYLYITGRASDMYISGGSNIDPREIEEKILTHPLVRAVGVVGAPDKAWGEVGYAVVVAENGLTPEDLLVWCRDIMARYKVPKTFHFVVDLPTTDYGKVTTTVLRDLLRDANVWPGE